MSSFFNSFIKAGASTDGQGWSNGPQGESSNNLQFSIQPLPGDTGFSQWVSAMKMVAQLPEGIPPEFRKRLWLQLADRHLVAKGVDWAKIERTYFSDWSHAADSDLGVQIVKDLHRTGCSLFCGKDGQENQILLKRVLLAYARWNKAVGYCQGFNMLAALILQVTEKNESDALKLMIYLIEGVLPDSYFADSLRGLSVDMAVFRELLESRHPRLSKHLDNLQNAAKDGSRSYEPPLTNVFTMQWFLTLFCNCLPQPTVLRVWDLILLEGNEILLRTALAIWQLLAERILSVRSADEFYCMMGALTRELLEDELVDENVLIKSVVAIRPLIELNTLREHYLYNLNPWGSTIPQSVDKQLKLHPKQNIALDISGLKKQYTRLKQRQRQAHIIFSAAISRPSPPVTMNHLLIGKNPLIPAKRIGPPKYVLPPIRKLTPSTLHWKDAPKHSSSSSSSDTELCDEESDSLSSEEDVTKLSQFDNLPLDSDTSLMIKDNTSAILDLENHKKDTHEFENSVILFKSETEDDSFNFEQFLSDGPKPTEQDTTNAILDLENHKKDTHEFENSVILFKTETEDDSFNFEQFLSDRLKPAERDTEEKVNLARRNSNRAMQIIQENSLILHRILQYQSRLSPSPPLLEPVESIEPEPTLEANDVFNLPTSYKDVSFIESNDDNQSLIQTNSPILDSNVDLKCPEYGSKYSNILEKSKSLDEKYNALILNNPTTKTFGQLTTGIKNEDTSTQSKYADARTSDVFTNNSKENEKESKLSNNIPTMILETSDFTIINQGPLNDIVDIQSKYFKLSEPETLISKPLDQTTSVNVDNQFMNLETIKKLESPSIDNEETINIDLKGSNVEQSSEIFNIHMYNHQNYNSRIQAYFKKEGLENDADNKNNEHNFEIEMLQNKELEGFTNRPSDTLESNTKIQHYSTSNDDKNDVSCLALYSSSNSTNDEIQNKYSFSNLEHKLAINWTQKPETLVDDSSKLLVSPIGTTSSSTCYDFLINSDENSKCNKDTKKIIGLRHTETCDNKENVTTNPLNLELESSISSTIKPSKYLPKSPLSP